MEFRGFDLLSDDVAIKILSMLTVNSMYKMSFVSKKFRQLLSSDPVLCNFWRRQLLWYTCEHLKDARDCVVQSTVQLCSINLTQPRTSSDEFTMVIDDHIFSCPLSWNFCSGLVCFVSSNHVYVANPTTHMFVKLPERKSASVFTKYGFGFGFIPSKKQYKVVHLFSSHLLDGYHDDDEDEEDVLCEIFTITDGGANDSGDWTIMNTPCAPSEMDHSLVCANGVLYWVGWDDGQCFILSLELENYQLESIPFPLDFSEKDTFTLNLVELKGCLYLLDQGVKNNFWLLKDHENRIWVKEYSIDLNGLGCSGLTDDSTYCFPLIEQEGELLIRVDGEGRGSELFYYDLKNEKFRSAAHVNTTGIFPKLYVASLFALGSRQVVKPAHYCFVVALIRHFSRCLILRALLNIVDSSSRL